MHGKTGRLIVDTRFHTYKIGMVTQHLIHWIEQFDNCRLPHFTVSWSQWTVHFTPCVTFISTANHSRQQSYPSIHGSNMFNFFFIADTFQTFTCNAVIMILRTKKNQTSHYGNGFCRPSRWVTWHAITAQRYPVLWRSKKYDDSWQNATPSTFTIVPFQTLTMSCKANTISTERFFPKSAVSFQTIWLALTLSVENAIVQRHKDTFFDLGTFASQATYFQQINALIVV